MTTRGLSPKLKRTKALVLEGLRGDRLARALDVSRSTAYANIERLVYMGELVAIGDPKSTPRIYEDGRKKPTFSDQPAPRKLVHVVPTSATSDGAVHSGRIPKTVRFHITGAYVVPVEAVGDHAATIRDDNGYTIGEWSPIANANGSIRQYGTVRLFVGEDLHFTFYDARDGAKLTVTPNPREVYYKHADRDGPALMLAQVTALLDALARLGWSFGQPVYNGTFHYAMTSPVLAPLLKYADRHDPENLAQSIHIDTSDGYPEIEVYDDHDNAADDVRLMYELPERIRTITDGLAGVSRTLDALGATVAQLTDIATQLTAIQTQTAQLLAGAMTSPVFDGVGYL